MPAAANRELLQMARDLANRSKEFCEDIREIASRAEQIQGGDDMTDLDSKSRDNRLMWAMLDCAPVFACRLTPGETNPAIYRTTPTLEALFGYFPGQLANARIQDLIPPDKWESHCEHFAKFLQHPTERQMGANTAIEPEGISREGQRFPIELTWMIRGIDGDTFIIATVQRQLRGNRRVEAEPTAPSTLS